MKSAKLTIFAGFERDLTPAPFGTFVNVTIPKIKGPEGLRGINMKGSEVCLCNFEFPAKSYYLLALNRSSEKGSTTRTDLATVITVFTSLFSTNMTQPWNVRLGFFSELFHMF